MNRMPKSPLRYGFVTGDGRRWATEMNLWFVSTLSTKKLVSTGLSTRGSRGGCSFVICFGAFIRGHLPVVRQRRSAIIEWATGWCGVASQGAFVLGHHVEDQSDG